MNQLAQSLYKFLLPFAIELVVGRTLVYGLKHLNILKVSTYEVYTSCISQSSVWHHKTYRSYNVHWLGVGMLWLTCGLHSDWSFLLQGWQFSLLLVFNHQKSTQYYLSHSLLWASNCLWWGKKCSLISCQLVPPIRPSLGFQVQFILHHIIPLAPEWMIQSGSGEIQSWVRKVSRGMGINFKINLKHSAIPHHSTPYCTPEALLPCFWETLLRNAIKAS